MPRFGHDDRAGLATPGVLNDWHNAPMASALDNDPHIDFSPLKSPRFKRDMGPRSAVSLREMQFVSDDRKRVECDVPLAHGPPTTSSRHLPFRQPTSCSKTSREPTSIFTQCVSDDSNHPSTTLATIFTSSERQTALPGPVSLRKAALILNDHKRLKREAPLTSSRRLPVSCSESSWHHTLFTLLRSPLAHRTRHHPLTLPGHSRTDLAIKILKNSAARSLPLNAISRSSNSPQNPFSTVPRTSRSLQTTTDTSPLRRPLKNSSAHKK
ncbi:hypothetical protein C8F01DRAFT_1261475 [Mycena amicta]|nr:hypothetical protein C8F01DRAFT_1261475 [Mycena amicta]